MSSKARTMVFLELLFSLVLFLSSVYTPLTLLLNPHYRGSVPIVEGFLKQSFAMPTSARLSSSRQSAS